MYGEFKNDPAYALLRIALRYCKGDTELCKTQEEKDDFMEGKIIQFYYDQQIYDPELYDGSPIMKTTGMFTYSH